MRSSKEPQRKSLRHSTQKAPRSTARSSRTNTVGWISIALAFVVLMLLIHYGMLMIGSPRSVQRQAPEQKRNITIIRGSIYDRYGHILAAPGSTYAITMWKPDIEDSVSTAKRLAEITKLSASEIQRIMSETDGFAYILRRTTAPIAEKVKELIRAGKLAGIGVDKEEGRYYPYGSIGSKVVGHTDTENRGRSGIEGQFDRRLSPAPSDIPKNNTSDVVYGSDIFLTLDIRLQEEVEKRAQSAFEVFNPEWMAMIVMDAKTGEILAMTSYPTFDPNLYYQYPDFARLNHGISYMYEPGSVMKIYSMASMLDRGVLKEDSTFVGTGRYVVPNTGGKVVITDYHEQEFGKMGPRDFIKHSSNTAVAHYALKLDDDDFYNDLRKFGFGDKTLLPLSGEVEGYIAPPSSWSSRSKPTIAFGQESLVTAAQMATAATAFANKGMLLEPRLIHHISTEGSETAPVVEASPIRRAIKEENIPIILEGMVSATTEGGTGINTAIEGQIIATKTGTGQKYDPSTKRYSETATIASAISLYPGNDPKYIIYGVMDTPRTKYPFGATTIAPIIREIIEYLIKNPRLEEQRLDKLLKQES